VWIRRSKRDRADHAVELGEELPPAVAVEFAAVVRRQAVMVAEHHGAQPLGPATRARSCSSSTGKPRNAAGNQQPHVERRGFGQVGQQPAVPFDTHAALGERGGDLVCLAGRQRVRTGHDVEQEREIARGAGHRTDSGATMPRVAASPSVGWCAQTPPIRPKTCPPCGRGPTECWWCRRSR